ncbi:MAG TPA: dUTP diphosphatase [Candidatus Levybacteria bacterium]|nr:dUTP diphosphatase [Candidatus Levybacteria bacterium]
MKIKIKRIDASLPLPQYATPGSVCFDLLARTDMEISSKTVALIPTNIIIETPPGYMFIVIPRSSTPKKKGLLIPHGIGVVDQDYSGPEDEVLFQVYNFTDEVVSIAKGDRLAQGCFVPIEKVEFEEVDKILDKSRGGVGSTG